MTFRNNLVPVHGTYIRSNRQKYHPGIPNEILEMARRGKFPEEWCAELGISIRTLYVWANEYPEFQGAVEAAWHALHAYWINLLRENITNPSLRQTAILQVMAKRFPATWGHQPHNTLEHFEARNEPAALVGQTSSSPKCSELKSMSEEELNARIRTLRSRLNI